MRLIAALSLWVATYGAAAVRPAGGTIDAIVTDTTLAPLANATVSLVGTSVRVVTGDNGRLVILAVPAGRRQLVIQRLGYRPVLAHVDLAEGDTVRLAFALQNAAPVLAGVTVTASSRSTRMVEFERRREGGGGQFLTAREIDRRNPTFATELVRAFSGVRVKEAPLGAGMQQYFAVSARAAMTQNCPVQVYVDEVRMPTPFNLDQLPVPSTIAGIEFYTGPANTPPQFGGLERRCGVLLVWTKDGGAEP